jgi:predicted nucleic acid-binding protein
VILYADTSSLFKIYLQEPDTRAVITLVTSADRLTTSMVAYAEMRSSLSRGLREGRISRAEHGYLVGELNRDWRRRIETIELTDRISFRAGDLSQTYALRGFDAIHLASALTLQEGLDELVTFSAFDDRLNGAALACGLATP